MTENLPLKQAILDYMVKPYLPSPPKEKKEKEMDKYNYIVTLVAEKKTPLHQIMDKTVAHLGLRPAPTTWSYSFYGGEPNEYRVAYKKVPAWEWCDDTPPEVEDAINYGYTYLIKGDESLIPWRVALLTFLRAVEWAASTTPKKKEKKVDGCKVCGFEKMQDTNYITKKCLCPPPF